jgi:hypothetical protein
MSRSSAARVLRLLLLTGCLVVPVTALASAASNKAEVNVCGVAKYRPATLFVSCSHGNILVSKLRWSKWTGKSARGAGTFLFSALHGSAEFHYRVTVALSDPVSCTKVGLTVFDLATFTYAQKPAAAAKAPKQMKLGCPTKG